VYNASLVQSFYGPYQIIGGLDSQGRSDLGRVRAKNIPAMPELTKSSAGGIAKKN